mmetsp:Transcript_15233/g.36245  ORF Transcript_15233/g.36245 Transcript_15233/m.36245 type:complete len:259 (+) Transcript_15233:126-902(+)
MANILGRYGYAREQAYFKQEQEIDLQNRRRKLLKERQGIEGSREENVSTEDFRDDSTRHFEVAMEILQQSTRIYDPNAPVQEPERRVKGGPVDLTPEEEMRFRMQMRSVASYSPQVPRFRSGRHRFDSLFDGASGSYVPAVRGLSPEAQELAQRTYAVGVRSLVYGSLIGAVGVSFLVGYTLHTYQIYSKEDMRSLLGNWMKPLADRVKTSGSGLSEGLREFFSNRGLTIESREENVFSRALSTKLAAPLRSTSKNDE